MRVLGERHEKLNFKIDSLRYLVNLPKVFPQIRNRKDWLRHCDNSGIAQAWGLVAQGEIVKNRTHVEVSRKLNGKSPVTPVELAKLAEHFRLAHLEPDAFAWLRDDVDLNEFRRKMFDHDYIDPLLERQALFVSPATLLGTLGAIRQLSPEGLRVGPFESLRDELQQSAYGRGGLDLTRDLGSDHGTAGLQEIKLGGKFGFLLENLADRWLLLLNLGWRDDDRYVLRCLCPGQRATYRRIEQAVLLPDREHSGQPGTFGWEAQTPIGRNDVLVVLTAKPLALPWIKPKAETDHRLSDSDLRQLLDMLSQLAEQPEAGLEIRHAAFLILG